MSQYVSQLSVLEHPQPMSFHSRYQVLHRYKGIQILKNVEATSKFWSDIINFHTEGPKILDTAFYNLVATATTRERFVHSCYIEWFALQPWISVFKNKREGQRGRNKQNSGEYIYKIRVTHTFQIVGQFLSNFWTLMRLAFYANWHKTCSLRYCAWEGRRIT